MTKKRLLATLLATAPVLSFAAGMPTAPDNFTGFSLGAGIGASRINVKQKVIVGSSSVTNKNHGYGFAGQLFAGYNYVFSNQVLLGAQAHYQYNSKTVKSNTSIAGVLVSFNGKTTLHNTYGVDLRLGYLSSPTHLWYVAAGPDWLRYKHVYSSSVGSETTKKTLATAKATLGAEQALTPHWHLGESLSYDFPVKTKIGTILTIKHTVSVVTALVSLAYKF